VLADGRALAVAASIAASVASVNARTTIFFMQCPPWVERVAGFDVAAPSLLVA
jgi:hypothetical protein